MEQARAADARRVVLSLFIGLALGSAVGLATGCLLFAEAPLRAVTTLTGTLTGAFFGLGLIRRTGLAALVGAIAGGGIAFFVTRTGKAGVPAALVGTLAGIALGVATEKMSRRVAKKSSAQLRSSQYQALNLEPLGSVSPVRRGRIRATFPLTGSRGCAACGV